MTMTVATEATNPKIAKINTEPAQTRNSLVKMRNASPRTSSVTEKTTAEMDQMNTTAVRIITDPTKHVILLVS